MKGRALRRALETRDAIRVNAPVPLITDTTELITPEMAQEMLTKNRHNRPVNWRKVQEYKETMKAGEWKLTPQGIILDGDGNIITGQKRLWAIVQAGVSVYMRVSRGGTKETAHLLDRGTPQTARDLASRDTEKKHSPIEGSIARALCALRGNLKPTPDDIAKVIVENVETASKVMLETTRIKKTKAVTMILAAICSEKAVEKCAHIELLAKQLEKALEPESVDRCWGRGAAFRLAMEQAKKLVMK